MGDLHKWLLSISDGDKVAFEALYNETKNLLFTIIFRITQNRELSEDILQDLFLRLYLSPPESAVNPRAYLCRMAHNIAVDSIRKQKPHAEWEQVEKILSYQTEDVPQRLDIEDAIQSLPERERQIVTLHINGELKFREIATILETPLGTILWAYQKAINKLRKDLGESS